MGGQKFALLAVLTVLTLPFPLLGDDLMAEADLLFKAGQPDKARGLYLKYLDDHWGSPSYGDCLLKAATTEPKIANRIKILTKYTSKLNSSSSREAVFSTLGSLYELSGDIEKALDAYEKAYQFSRPSRFDLLLRSGFLQLELGQTQEALNKAVLAYSKDISDPLKNKALQLIFTIYARERAVNKGNKLVETEQLFINTKGAPSLLFSLYRFYDLTRQETKAGTIKKMLEKKYPDSAEALILKNKIHVLPSPVNLW